jgi:hypothetical protein
VCISSQSLRSGRVHKDKLIRDISPFKVEAAFLVSCCALLPLSILFLYELMAWDENNKMQARPLQNQPIYVRGRYPSYFPATVSWLAIASVAIALTWYYGDKKTNEQRLKKIMLDEDVLIQPGQTVRAIAFLDARQYNGLLTFRVLSHDKMSYVATFDLVLLG